MPDLARVELRIPAELKAELEELAAEKRRSLNVTITMLLERALNVDPLVDSL